MAVEHLNEDNFDEKIASGVTLVDFFATWCGPCKMLGPVIEELGEESDGSYKVFKLDVDEGADIAMDYGVMSVPTMVIFKNGEEFGRMIGVRPKAEILEEIKKAIG